MCVVPLLYSVVFVIVFCVCVGYVCCYVRKNALHQCLSNYWEEGYGLYEVPLSNMVYVF